MATIVTRAGKGSALTHTEMDANFTNLNTSKVESLADLSVSATDSEIDVLDMSASGSTSGQILTSNGTGTTPTWQDAASGGADTSLSNLTTAGEKRACSAWIHFDGTATVAIRGQYNVNSISDYGTGHYGVNFSTAMTTATGYSSVATCTNDTTGGAGVTYFDSPYFTAWDARLKTVRVNNTAQDMRDVSVMFFDE